jgi:hypothetical protein
LDRRKIEVGGLTTSCSGLGDPRRLTAAEKEAL